jgi:hypothetical protein
MNFQGTPGQIRVIIVDPNNIRIALDMTSTSAPIQIQAGTYNEVTVDSNGRVVSGVLAPTTVPNVPQTSSSIDAREGDYGGIEPNWNPTGGIIGIAIDIGSLGNNRIWWYFAGAWN